MEFREGVKCYCGVTQAWMYEPLQAENKIVWACDRQMEQPEGGEVIVPTSPAKILKQSDAEPAGPVADFGLDNLPAPVTQAGPDSF